ncbi:NPHP3 [Bugula neritina]|uniref:Nephrocystin-3 n=1 Tax=Bugula neritina TaxID=10212 RepID=A0A7J7J1E6_BUGNE|nr:NPHP3 [Bugula neritina]
MATACLFISNTFCLYNNVVITVAICSKASLESVDPDKQEVAQETSADLGFSDTSNDSCGCNLWDEHSHSEHLEAFYYAAKCSHECSLDKLFERLNNHITAPGPSPPLLVTGSPGCGKSLLLARWIQQHQVRGSPGIILYHFVGCKNSVSADPIHMIRRLTSQLMQHAVNPPALTCEPSRLMEEFPRWLEKVSTKISGGVTVVIDGLDKFQQGDIHLRWLLDPLPVDSRVIVSANEETCAPAWKQWLLLRIEPLASKSVKELLRNELQQKGCYLDSDSEAKILTHCRTPETCSPLFITILASCLASISDEKRLQHQLDQCLAANDAIELYLVVLDYVREELETTEQTKGSMKKALKLIHSSRNGLGDWECLALLPNITWNFWAILTHTLLNLNVIAYRAGLICLAHDQVREAIELKYFPKSDNGKQLGLCRKALVDYFSKYTSLDRVTCHVSDELPWLHQQLGDKESLKNSLLFLGLFLRLYIRGRCNELISYWLFIGIDKNQMAELYLSATQKLEGMVGKVEFITLHKIADLYEAQGKFLRDLGMLKEACNPLQRSLELRMTTLDPDHPQVAQVLHLLAGVHAQWSKYLAAESLYKQALDIYQNAYGADHIMVAKELDALIVLYQKQNKHDAAESLKKQANFIRKKNRVPQISTEENDNIRSSSFKNRRSKMQIEDLTMGPDTAELASKLNELGVLYYVQGNHSTAETFFKKSMRIREQLLPSDHPDLGQSCKNLAALYYDQKNLEKAEPLYDKALQIKLKHFNADSPQVISIVKNLAPVCKKLQKWSKAAHLYKQIVELREKSAGDQPDPSLATAMVNLAVIYCHMSQQSDAEPLYERALKIYESSLGLIHPRVAETLHNIAVLKYEQCDYEAAAKLYKRATDIKSSPSYLKESKVPASRTSSVNSIPIVASAQVKTQKVFIEALESHS